MIETISPTDERSCAPTPVEIAPLLSICTTTYRQPRGIESFLRSLFALATDNNFEVIVVADRSENAGSSVGDLLQRLNEETSLQIPYDQVCDFTKSGRINHAENCIPIWKTIYPNEVVEYAVRQLSAYSKGEITDLWMQYAYPLNVAASKARGQFLMLTPGDYMFLFDVSRMARTIERKAKLWGSFFGQVELVAPFRIATPGVVADEYNATVKNYVTLGFDAIFSHLRTHHTFRQSYPVLRPFDRFWSANHGIRIVDRETFEDAGTLMDELLTKPGPTDIFNRVARGLACERSAATMEPGYWHPPYKSIFQFTGEPCRMAYAPFDPPATENYMYPRHCEADYMRRLRYAEEAYARGKHPEWAKFWK